MGLVLVAALAAGSSVCPDQEAPGGDVYRVPMAVQLMGHPTPARAMSRECSGGTCRRGLLGLLVDRAQGYSWTSAARDALLRLFRLRLTAVGPTQVEPPTRHAGRGAAATATDPPGRTPAEPLPHWSDPCTIPRDGLRRARNQTTRSSN